MKTLSETPIDWDREQISNFRDSLNAYSNVTATLLKNIEEFASGEHNVVFFGEVGTGKRYLAKRLHKSSSFSTGVFSDVYCNSLKELLEQLTNEETEADAPSTTEWLGKLRINLRSGGTLLLNSFSELSRRHQSLLIKLLADAQKWIRTQSDIPNFRIIIRLAESHNTTLDNTFIGDELISNSGFSAIYVPPLRDRCEDIPVLIDRFLMDYALKNYTRIHAISFSAVYKCISYYWPGNVLQLKNVIEHAATTAPPGGVITNDHLPFSIDWKSPTGHINMKQNESFKRAEKVLLSEVISQSDLAIGEIRKVKNKFREHVKDK